MRTEKPKEIIITENSILFRKIFFLMIISSTMLGFFVLIVLQFFVIRGDSTQKGFSMEPFVQILLLISIGIIGLIFLLLIPKARKKEEPFHRFGAHIVIFILGVESFGLFGLIIGLIQLFLGNAEIDWYLVGFFFLLAVLDAFILYLTEINPTLNACEVGKSIPASPHENDGEKEKIIADA